MPKIGKLNPVRSNVTKFGSLVLGLFLISFFCLSCEKDRSQSTSSAEKTIETISPKIEIKIADYLATPKDWTMFMADLQFSGRNSDDQIKPPFELAWKFKTGGPIQASPIVVNGTVYVGSLDGFFYALDAKSWDIRWQFDAKNPIRRSATFWNNRIFFTTANNEIFALSAETGEMIWSFQTQTLINSTPIIGEDLLHIGAYTDKIYVIDAVSGDLVRTQNRQIEILGVPFRCVRGKLLPIEPQNSVDLWRKKIPFSHSHPTIANGYVWIGSRDHQIYVFDLNSGEIIWRFKTDGYVDSAIAISDAHWFVTSRDGYIYAFRNRSDQPKIPTEKTQIGIVVRDGIWIKTDGGEIRLNDGTELEIIESSIENFTVKLPNGEIGIAEKDDIGIFTDRDEILFNSEIYDTIKKITLINGAEMPSFSPDGKFIAFFRRTDLSGRYWHASELWLLDRESGRSKRLCGGHFYNPQISWSMDGNFIAFSAYEKDKSYIWITDKSAKNLIKLDQGDAPSWSPIANQIAFRRSDGRDEVIYRINIDGSGLTPIVKIEIESRPTTYEPPESPIWSADGQTVSIGLQRHYFKSDYAKVRTFNLSGQTLIDYPTRWQKVNQIAWSADQKTICFVGSGSGKPDPTLDKKIEIANAETPNDRTILKHTSPVWSPIGKKLAYLEKEDCMGLRWKVWVLDLESGRKIQIARTNKNLTALEWLPDGQQICLWHTSKYHSGDHYKLANTICWIVKMER